MLGWCFWLNYRLPTVTIIFPSGLVHFWLRRNKILLKFWDKIMVLKDTWYFFQRRVWLACKKVCFEYHSLLDIMTFLEYLKLHSNPKFSQQWLVYFICVLNTMIWNNLSSNMCWLDWCKKYHGIPYVCYGSNIVIFKYFGTKYALIKYVSSVSFGTFSFLFPSRWKYESENVRDVFLTVFAPTYMYCTWQTK
jgi:hypothetical protein